MAVSSSPFLTFIMDEIVGSSTNDGVRFDFNVNRLGLAFGGLLDLGCVDLASSMMDGVPSEILENEV